MGESKPTVCKYVTEKVRNTQISEQRLPGYNGRHTRLERDCDPVEGTADATAWVKMKFGLFKANLLLRRTEPGEGSKP